MTMPHLMNCGHAPKGWCLDCVETQWKALETSKATGGAMRDLLVELAPFVAVLGRSQLVWPEAREALLKVEPTMLKVLLETKPEEPLLEKFPSKLWPDGPGGGPYSDREKVLQQAHKQAAKEQRERLGLPPYDWSRWW